MLKPGQIVFENVVIPDIKGDEVLIKVIRIGICGSDIHVCHGKHPYTPYPVIQGHEFSGKVVKVGKNVKKIKEGDKVVVQPQVVCGECYPCKHGRYNVCDNLKVMGFQTEGCAKEYFKIEEAKVLKIPESMSYDEGALVEPLAVACHALRRSEIELKDKNIIILGADISEFRLNLAKECGIDIVLDVSKYDLNEEIVKEFGAERADLILECVGSQVTINDAINNARKGSDIIVVGVYPEEVRVNMGFVQDRELRLIGTLMYREEDYLDAIDLIATKKVKADKLITDYFEFKDYDLAYKHIEERKDKVLKVMIKLTE
jgi:L-iditol 2-dehydrogenase